MEPNQQMNQPQQPQQPMQPETGSVEDQMAAEMETSRLIEEQQAQVAAANAAAEAAKPKSAMSPMLIGLIVAIVIAVCGIGFGVFAMVQKGNVAASYEKQITTLKNSNAELAEQLATASEAAAELDEATALKVLQDAETPEAGYTVEYARINEWYEGDDGELVARVSYVVRTADGLAELETYMAQDEDGAWGIASAYLPADAVTDVETDVVVEEIPAPAE